MIWHPGLCVVCGWDLTDHPTFYTHVAPFRQIVNVPLQSRNAGPKRPL